MREYLIKLPEIGIQAYSDNHAYDMVTEWLVATLGNFPLSSRVIIRPPEVILLCMDPVEKKDHLKLL